MKIFKNDVLVLEDNKYGILKKKEFYNKDDMNNIINFEDTTGTAGLAKKILLYMILCQV